MQAADRDDELLVVDRTPRTAKAFGSDGLHALFPLERRYTYADRRALAATIARMRAHRNW
jgi:DNA primase